MELLKPPHGKTPLERILRTLLLFAVFATVIWLYQMRFEKVIDEVREKDGIADKSGALTKEQRGFIVEYARQLRDAYGLDLRLSIGPDADKTPADIPPGVIHIGLDPQAGKAVTVFPSLVRQAIGQGFITYLNQEHFPPYFKSGNWTEGLGEALDLIRDRLASAAASASQTNATSDAPATENRN